MIAYVTVGTNDLARAADFFDKVFGVLGAKRAFANDRMIGWSNGGPMIGVTKPYDGAPQSVGNGIMVSLAAGSKENVAKVYEAAIAAGATCEGEPGPRNGMFTLAYFRDLDGNKFAVFHPGV